MKAADEIRSFGTVIPRRYENVAVLSCDVTNFTAHCDKHEPEDVVSRLDGWRWPRLWLTPNWAGRCVLAFTRDLWWLALLARSIWSDTVNMAARMMGVVTPGGVAVTKEIWERVKSDFDGEPVSILEIKGKGKISVFSLGPSKA